MVTPSARRRAAKHLVERKRYSVRMACRIAGISRTSFYYIARRPGFEQRLVEKLHELSRRYPRYGYEMMTWKLNRLGWRVNKKRIQRLWRHEGLRVPRKAIKRRRSAVSTTVRQRALYPNHVWSWDFVFDRTEDGRALKILNVVDEYSRYSIAMEVNRHFRAQDVVYALGQAMLQHGIPGCIRSDNGSEFIAAKVKDWLAENGVGIMYIEPGSPWQNPYVESLNARLRDDCLNTELFTTVREAEYILQQWRDEYNQHRPHGSLKKQTPAEVYQRVILPDCRAQKGLKEDNADLSTLGNYYH